MNDVAGDENVKAGTLGVWEIVTTISPETQMHMLGMAHPFHIHRVQLEVLERAMLDDELQKLAYTPVSDGYVDTG